ncbi:MAG: putative bifunctional diguanylate cyclase/phosphodiesterase [Pseudonocardiaceae bacterium]
MSYQDQVVTLAELARAWSDVVNASSEVPIPSYWVEECFRDLLGRMVDVLRSPEYRPELTAQVGTTLVAKGFTGENAMARTAEVLGRALPRMPELYTVDRLDIKIPALLDGLASGYATALALRTLDEREAWFRDVVTSILDMFDSAPVGMVISRLDGTITELNPGLIGILHYPPAKLVGQEVRELFHPDHAAALATAYQALTDRTQGPYSCDEMKRGFQTKAQLLAANGDTVWAVLTVLVLRDAVGDPTHHLTMIEDITDRQLLEQQVRHQSLHDLLTGLPNRLHFAIHLEAALERDRTAPITVCKIDLDRFSVVNDGLGLGSGDFVLRSVAGRLRALFAGERAFVARFGADEFAVLIEESPTTPNAATLAALINAELSEPVYFAGRGLSASACIGFVRRTAGETDANELIRAGQATLHRAKQTGRGQWAMHDPLADAEQRARYALASDMPVAWENGEITISYQPLVRLDLAADDADATSALAVQLYWEHPEHGVVPHDDCLALAEQSGLVLLIGPWMLQQASNHLRGWQDRLGASVPVRVDLTTHLAQDPDLVAVVRRALAQLQLLPGAVQLGMPVEVLLAGRGDAVDNVRTLADIGVPTVLTHYDQALGNLVLLEGLPVHGVELAGRWVDTTAPKPDSMVRSAVASLVPLIRRTGATIAVAGIDNAEEADWWREIGADFGRGAAFTPPMTPAAVPALLRRNPP